MGTPSSARLLFSAALLAASCLASRAALAASLGNLTKIENTGSTYTLTAGSDKVQVIFYKSGIVRIWLGPAGSFTNPAANDIVVSYTFPPITTQVTDAADYQRLESDSVVIRAYKMPLHFEMYAKDNTTLLWKESEPLSWDTGTATQKLVRGATEYFFGGGMQNGFFSHRDRTISIAIDNKWTSGGHPNPAPFYMSTAGYGVFRNTWATGSYDFGSGGVKTLHNEARFDAFYFYGPSLKEVLTGYTEVTGRPYIAPMYGLELGNADCYNTSNPTYTGTKNKPGKSTTPDVIPYATGFRTEDMPGGWYLPNDGYGCGYTDLTRVVAELHKVGFYTGLWTQAGLKDIATEVGTSGTRMVKTDVAWVGRGYKFALDGVKQAFAGIENNSDARAYIWTVDGWAGTQRYAVVWTGDQSGDWENIRFHIPTLVGSGLSAQNYASGDVDGIFGGSPKTYVRDLQWKVFVQSLMTMSGWATPEDKQPYKFADPYKSTNRKYLKLRERLLPYFYTYAAEAYASGVPAVRALVLEFPSDAKTWDTTTQYEFMSGEWFLVAPVYTDTAVRTGIYLPQGNWIDYWDGKVYAGPQTIASYAAPLEKLPLFVRAGAIIPMWPEMLYFQEKPHDPITFDIYPEGFSSFTLYEDDGVTRSYRTGASAKQTISCSAGTAGNLTVTVGASTGSYTGKPVSRQYLFDVHLSAALARVLLNGAALTQRASQAALDAAADGWFFDSADRAGIVHVKVQAQALDQPFQVVFGDGNDGGSTGGTGGAGGTAGAGGSGGSSGGAAGSGGTAGSGGVGGSGGAAGSGGSATGGAGGASGRGGASGSSSGGSGGVGGAGPNDAGRGDVAGSGGNGGARDASSDMSAGGVGGRDASADGRAGGAMTGGAGGASGGTSGSGGAGGQDDTGCACALSESRGSRLFAPGWLLAAAAAIGARGRRRRRPS